MARKTDPFVREMRKWAEDNVESVERSAGEKIGRARFVAYGKSAYPDATFTLRLAYGTVKGYDGNGKKIIYSSNAGDPSHLTGNGCRTAGESGPLRSRNARRGWKRKAAFRLWPRDNIPVGAGRIQSWRL